MSSAGQGPNTTGRSAPNFQGTSNPGPVMWDHKRFHWDIQGMPEPYIIGSTICSVTITLFDGTQAAQGWENDGGGWTVLLERLKDDGSWEEVDNKTMNVFQMKNVPMKITTDVLPGAAGTYRLGFSRSQGLFFVGLAESINIGTQTEPFTAQHFLTS